MAERRLSVERCEPRLPFLFIDCRPLQPICKIVIRLLLSMLCALGLAFAPVSAGAAAQPSTTMPGCAMDGRMPAKQSDHGKTDCCTPACRAPAPAAAVLPTAEIAIGDLLHGPKPTSLLNAKLASFVASALDPPPRA